MKASIENIGWGDALNALLAVALTSLSYWQAEVGMRNIREHMSNVSKEMSQIKNDINIVRRDGQVVSRSTRRIDETSRKLLRDQRYKRDDSGSLILPW
jgi:cob(I)alamin adenosyltransferase